MGNCIFCKIIKGEISCYKIYESKHVLAFLDISKDVDGHTLVIPKKHTKNIAVCPSLILTETIKAVKKIAAHYKKLGYDVNILNNCGECAEQSVMHLHFHIIPRKKNDKLKVFPQLEASKLSLEKACNKFKLN